MCKLPLSVCKRPGHPPGAGGNCLLESVKDDFGAHSVGDREPEHSRGALVADGAHVRLAITDAHLRYVRDPRLVSPFGVKVPVHQFGWVRSCRVGPGRGLDSLGLTPTMPSLAIRAATVLWLIRSPASLRSAVTGGDPSMPRDCLWKLMVLKSRSAPRTSLGSARRYRAVLPR